MLFSIIAKSVQRFSVLSDQNIVGKRKGLCDSCFRTCMDTIEFKAEGMQNTYYVCTVVYNMRKRRNELAMCD